MSADVEGTHIRFVHNLQRAGKTETWLVLEKREGQVLAQVKWFGRWRCYAFFPLPGSTYEEVCLHEIADFVAARTKEHRARKKAAA